MAAPSAGAWMIGRRASRADPAITYLRREGGDFELGSIVQFPSEQQAQLFIVALERGGWVGPLLHVEPYRPEAERA